ncbi:GntR family transcriptional regulator [Salipiger bermudensis]|uniref:GntR family transcriptional regulator n=1 Tax=Salipiger bermudensis TaxID=344736 RepID=UPI001C9923C0|nr:GntR family transcriptional regulator [Salipiger bermudensis]MBY6005555.1 GntR family transcriptional regulator [Salipiger bermudensis]
MPPQPSPASTSQRAYAELRERLLRATFLPGEKLNEVALAAELALSRTPLREALNRLNAEGLLVHHDRGFAAPSLDPERVFDLFEARLEIECATIRLACERADPAALDELAAFLEESGAESPEASVGRLIELDIGFHDRIARLSGNAVLRQMLANLNDRLHLIRWIAMEGRREQTQTQHRDMLAHLRDRDAEAAMAAMRVHILHRKEDILAAVKAAYGHVYTSARS